jgi:hypothetical protein
MNWTSAMRAAFEKAGIKPPMDKNAGIKPIKEWNAHVSYKTSQALRAKGILV